jgi:lipoate-protein ligase A
VLRESGGGAVLTGPWLVSASVVVPHGHAWVCGGVVDSYRQIAELHVSALADIGIAAQPLAPGDVARANATGTNVKWACFGSLSPWEIVAARGRKLVGLAQRRRREAVLLVAGTLVGAPDWSLLCEATGHAGDEPQLKARTVSCDELTGRRIEAEHFAVALRARLHAALTAGTPSR